MNSHLLRHYARRRKPILLLIFLTLALIALAHLLSSLTLDRAIQYKRVPFRSEKIPPELNGFTIAFISDTHDMTAVQLRAMVEKLNKYNPDIAILGGDFPSASGAPARAMAELGKIETKHGIFGIEGNHDNYRTLFAAMEQNGITPLSNSGIRISENLYLAGVEDLWNRSPDIQAAISQAKPDDFVILAAHNPDVAMRQDTVGCDLILSGHTHGGQITFLGLWAPTLSLRKTVTDYGQRFMSGWSVSRDGIPVYVSRGVGTFQRVPRVFARPQVVLITLFSD